MVKNHTLPAALALTLASALALGQTTQPATAKPAPLTNDQLKSLTMRAGQAFNAGQYAVALPMLQDLAAKVQDRPDELSSIQEQIRVCEKQLALPQTQFGPVAPAPITGDGRTVHVRPPNGQTLVFPSIKDLGNFDYDAEKGGNVPKDVLALTGAKIKVKGFMIPLDQAENISEFALVPSLFACCFGQPPSIQHTVVVHCPPGKAVSYFPDEITVEGPLTVQEKKEDGYIVSLFEMQAQSVKPAPK